MSDKDNLGDRVHAREIEKKRQRGFFSKAYHRFFEGYSEVVVPKSNGKGTKIERIYTADYYRQDLPKRKRLLIRIFFVIVFLSAGTLFISSSIQPLPINSTWYIVIFQAFSLGFLLWSVIALFTYLFSPKDLTIAEYRNSSLHLKRATLGAAISLLLTAIASLVFIILTPMENYIPIVFCISKNLLAGFLIFGIHIIEKNIKYLTIPNEKKLPDDHYEIK